MSPESGSATDSNRAVGAQAVKPRDSPGDHNAPKGQQGTRRFSFNGWPDEQDRDLCSRALVLQPEQTPISGRIGLAVAKWGVVDRREQRVLICNRVHEGDCEWPWDVQAS